MKDLLFIFSFCVFITLSSCGNSSVKIDPNLSAEEAKAVVLTEKSLPGGSKIESYQVVVSTLPLALLDNEYKNLRDEANKARLDYRTNMTRGLPQIAQKNLETLQNIQNTIVEKSKNLEKSSPEYIFVLADVKEKNRRDNNLTGFIAVYDPKSLEQVDLLQVTTPLYNNAVMVTEALEGNLSNPEKGNEIITSNNPIVDFILKSNPK
ncbi:MAG: hypothetical protein J1F16_00945 [Muribaculaceae bacterium]|nr:hypothetical protein [Muribaculaceae bacterium]